MIVVGTKILYCGALSIIHPCRFKNKWADTVVATALKPYQENTDFFVGNSFQEPNQF